MKAVSARTLSTYYIIALTIIAGLSVVFHLIVQHELHVSKGSSALINLSGRQRMLSQRMAGMAAEYRLGVPYAHQELVTATDSFERNHELLLHEIQSGDARDTETASLKTLYEVGSSQLDHESRSYIDQAHRIAAAPPASPLLADLLPAFFAEARSPLLTNLNEAVTIRQHGAEIRVARMQRVQYGILAIVLVTLLTEAFTIFKPMVHRIMTVNDELLLLATTDPLTRAANRRSFMDSGRIELERMRRTGRPLSLLALDVDHFKLINDTHGHAAGDLVLQALSTALLKGLRTVDVLGRIGGEEFAILLPDTASGQANQVAERLREAIERLRIPNGDSHLNLTVSIGLVEFSTATMALSDAMIEADAALYQAKSSGRNRVVLASKTDSDLYPPLIALGSPQSA